jgi:hypothetical protein
MIKEEETRLKLHEHDDDDDDLLSVVAVYQQQQTSPFCIGRGVFVIISAARNEFYKTFYTCSCKL